MQKMMLTHFEKYFLFNDNFEKKLSCNHVALQN